MDSWQRSGLTLTVRDAGPAAGPAVLCLHGFPQDGSAYDAVVPLLVAGGARVLVPDQRGYSPGARPAGRAPYRLGELVGDVLALLDAAGLTTAHVVGHDWGGVVAWALAAAAPQRVDALTVLGTPHPAALRASLPRSTQALRSSYMAAFQVPRAPEALLTARRGAVLRAALLRSGLPREHAERYAARMLEPGALTAALAWYRALVLRPASPMDAVGAVRVPTTLLHATRDPFFAPSAVRTSGDHVRAPFERREVAVGHWVPELAPAEVARAVLDRLGPGAAGAGQ